MDLCRSQTAARIIFSTDLPDGLWAQTIERFVNNEYGLKFSFIFNWKPVQGSEDCRNVCLYSGSSVLSEL